MSFGNLIGNEDIKILLNKSVVNNKVLHSYLFYGTEGIGKLKFAREFAKMILCTEKKGNCNTCKSCIEFESENHPDFYEIKPEKDTIKIEQIRQMQAKVIEKPIISKNKVFLIDDADTLTKPAQNCLLKTLEEPPEYITIILVASNENNLLATIKSRCSKVFFHKIEDRLLYDFLKETYGYTDLTPKQVQSFQGSIKNALVFEEKKDTYTKLEKVFSNIEKYNYLDSINNLDVLYENKENINELLDYIQYLLYKKIKNSKYISYIEEIEKTKNRLKANSNFEMCIDNLLFKIWEGNN